MPFPFFNPFSNDKDDFVEQSLHKAFEAMMFDEIMADSEPAAPVFSDLEPETNVQDVPLWPEGDEEEPRTDHPCDECLLSNCSSCPCDECTDFDCEYCDMSLFEESSEDDEYCED